MLLRTYTRVTCGVAPQEKKSKNLTRALWLIPKRRGICYPRWCMYDARVAFVTHDGVYTMP